MGVRNVFLTRDKLGTWRRPLAIKGKGVLLLKKRVSVYMSFIGF